MAHPPHDPTLADIARLSDYLTVDSVDRWIQSRDVSNAEAWRIWHTVSSQPFADPSMVAHNIWSAYDWWTDENNATPSED